MANFNDAFQPEAGINFDDLLGIFAGTTDPISIGEAAPVGSLFLRSNGSMYQKTGAGDTQWTQFVAGSDVLLKISATDTTADYLNPKLQVSANLTKTVNNPGANETLTLDLSNVGTAGTYTSLTVDSKGRVTAGTNPGFLTTNQNITLTGDVTGTGSTSIATTLSNTGVIAGSYTNTNLTVDSKGRITIASSGYAGAGAMYLLYMSDTTATSGDPGPGHVRWNNATVTSATEIYVDIIDDQENPTGVDLSAYLATIKPNTILWIQDRDLASTYQRWRITTVTNSTGFYTFGVTLLDSANFSTIPNNHDLALSFGFAGTLGTVYSVDITAPAAGITVTGGPITSTGTFTLALANDLGAVEGLTGAGAAFRTAADTWALRSLNGTTNRITVTNGDGVAGNPTVDIASTYVGQTSITTLGTISTGTWQGTTISTARGGTGLTSIGLASQVLGVNITASGLEYKSIVAGTGISVTNTAGQISIATIGASGTVTSVAATAPAAGITISGSPITTTGTLTFALANDLAALEGLSGTGLARRTGADTWTLDTTAYTTNTGTVTSVAATGSTGLTVGGSPITTTGTLTLTLDTGLQNLASFAAVGMLAATGTDTWAARTITAPAAGITITNGNGVAGNPTLALANDLAAVEGLATTGIAVRTAADTWATRTITAGSTKIAVTNGGGVAGNPTVDLGAVTLDDLSNVVVAAATVGQLLYFNGTDWVPVGGSGAGGGLRIWTGNIASQTGTSTILPGAAVPLVTAGTQIMSQTVTPLSTTSAFAISLSLSVSASTNNNVHTAALFRGSTFIGGAIQTFASGGNSNAITFLINDLPATTSPITYTIRYGTNANTWYINRRVGEDTYGGVRSGWQIQEF